MSTLDLRPLSVGELLDRTFSLYRRNFLLFVGISALPNLLVLALQLVQLSFMATRPALATPRSTELHWASSLGPFGAGGFILMSLVGVIVYLVAYLFSQGATVYAVSELYLGRSTTIGQSLSRVRGQLGSLLGVVLLNGLVIGLSFIFLIIPGIYMACRLIVCVPSALLEECGPRGSLERSFELTRSHAGRAFLIYLLYVVILYAALILVDLPFGLAVASSGRDPAMVRLWSSLMQVGNFAATVLVTPVLAIASSIFYFDLRVRKEGLDLQLMMNPLAPGVPSPRSATSLL